jgi:predicted nuclease of predicted toxin-antitoxin system
VKLLLDACVAMQAVEELATAGHDVEWAGHWTEDPGDEEILRRATAASRVLVTLDRDFGELAIVRHQPHCGIVRLVGLASTEQGSTCHRALARHGDGLIAGDIVTVERMRVRVRPAEWPRTEE